MPEYAWEYADSRSVEAERGKLSRLYTFIRRYISKTIAPSRSSHYAMGLFSRDGVLLDLFAKEGYTLERCQLDGIRVGSKWAQLGYNAVSQGILTGDSAESVGEEHVFPPLKRYAVYYAPIRVLSPYEPYEPREECGLGIITPVENAWDDYMAMIRGVAHDMMITLQFNNIATMYYERSGKGILSIDNMMSPTGQNLATYYNDELFRILETRPMEIYYKPVETLIDPLPANRELWDIVENHRVILNQPLDVTCHGKTVELIASTDAFNQPMINAHGVVFYFTTRQKITAELSRQVANGAIKTFDDIIGNNAGLRSLIQKAARMAQTDSNIMILGESGTGKDVFAQAIHNASSRRGKPFVALNCGALPRDLVESELFGYETGAFTGARKNGNVGKFELANGGTIFLDEIGEMPLDLQAKLLRVTESKQLMRLGGNKTIHVDVRIISATNANVEGMIQQKLFRADLYYRLSTMKLHLMPLRERRDDIVPLAEYFIRSVSRRIDKTNIMRFSDAAKALLTQMDWQGNVRELQNLIECIVQLYPGDIILPEYILDNVSEQERLRGGAAALSAAAAEPPAAAAESPQPQLPPQPPEPAPAEPEGPARRKRKHLTREDLCQALAACGNNRTDASQYLGISRRTFYRKLEEFGLTDAKET